MPDSSQIKENFTNCEICGSQVSNEAIEIHNEFCNKYLTDDPKCEKCGTSLDYYEEEFKKCWWECPKCGNKENEKGW